MNADKRRCSELGLVRTVQRRRHELLRAFGAQENSIDVHRAAQLKTSAYRRLSAFICG
jgi:hypothetical protein